MSAFVQSRWRRVAAPIIAEILAANVGQPKTVVDAALREAYPFGERKYHPYKIWLDEVQRQRGKKWPLGHKRAWENSEKRKRSDWERLAEHERIYGRRTA